jgi:hypothetical protein
MRATWRSLTIDRERRSLGTWRFFVEPAEQRRPTSELTLLFVEFGRCRGATTRS